ncbi:RidA family protein [Neisseriaceae bacterium TC5R-5]|nr:RidA family protein [Neisseriaceae bacterium TC5R-5]
MAKHIIETDKAPAAIGTYSQAVKVGKTIYLSGQIAMNPETMILVDDDFVAEVKQVLQNLKAVCEAAGGNLDDIVKLNVYLTDMENFGTFNAVMGQFFKAPFPARAAVGVASLPRGVQVEVDGIMVIPEVPQ